MTYLVTTISVVTEVDDKGNATKTTEYPIKLGFPYYSVNPFDGTVRLLCVYCQSPASSICLHPLYGLTWSCIKGCNP